jgi:hypothetical protein
MVKPIIASGQINWYICPKCNTKIYPLVMNPIHIKRPNKCIICNEAFDWSGYDVGQALESAGTYVDNPTLREA